MKHLLTAVLACSSLCTALAAQAADFTVSGQITFHNDVVLIDLAIANPSTNVKLWTDSWKSGLNFDPMAALWLKTANGYSLVSEVDDDDTVDATQGFYDTGFKPSSLAAGQYRVSLVTSFNPSNGPLLSQGFAYDSQPAVLLTQWTQPSYNPDNNDQKGGFWQLRLNNVDNVSVVPEPASWLLLAIGLAGAAVWRRLPT